MAPFLIEQTMSEDEYFDDLARRLRRRFPRSLRCLTLEGIASALRAMEAAEVGEVERQLDSRDLRDLKRTLEYAELSPRRPAAVISIRSRK
jgi:hypothetical protein